MLIKIDQIRGRLRRLGWNAQSAKLLTLGGDPLWMISARRGKHFFSAQGHTEADAWRSAWRLVKQIQHYRPQQSCILPFPGTRKLSNRAG